MEELRFALLILGGIAIIAILVHGLWSLRKNNQATEKPRVEPIAQKTDADGFDEFGIGEVRVVDSGESKGSKEVSDSAELIEEQVEGHVEGDVVDSAFEEPKVHAVDSVADADTNEDINDYLEPEVEQEKQEVEEPPKKLYGSVVSNPKPTMVNERSRPENSNHQEPETSSIPEPPTFLLKEEQESVTAPPADNEQGIPESDDVTSFSLDEAPSEPKIEALEENDKPTDSSLVAQTKRIVSRKRARSSSRKSRVEPSLGDDQMRIDFDSTMEIGNEPGVSSSAEESSTSNQVESQEQQSTQGGQEQEVLVLNVRAPNEQPINGAALLPMLLTLGFKFGDQDIFHRHVNSNGKGPVLFSLANMFKPGVFDIDNLENFTTQGVSLFMILPIEGEPHQVFNMMHNAARKLAEEFSCQILDGRRSVLTKQGLQQYVEKIREFERQRMIARN
jgi:cell division protein ZipA